jgi:hypothetical protein
MAKLTRLGIILDDADAEEFWKNEENSTFTEEQLEFYKNARRVYKEHPF